MIFDDLGEKLESKIKLFLLKNSLSFPNSANKILQIKIYIFSGGEIIPYTPREQTYYPN